MEGLTTFRSDRDCDLSSKSHGGGVCVYINNNWCNNTTEVRSYCSPGIEYLTIRCRPFYLPKEFTAVSISAVYTPAPMLIHRRPWVSCITPSMNSRPHTQKVFLLLQGISIRQIWKQFFPSSTSVWILPQEAQTLWTWPTATSERHLKQSPAPTSAPQTISLWCWSLHINPCSS